MPTRLVAFFVAVLFVFIFIPPAQAASGSRYTMNITWPLAETSVSSTQTFKAGLLGMSLAGYRLYWQVDDGILNEMRLPFAGPYAVQPRDRFKVADVDFSGWNWRADNRYRIRFVAKNLANTATLATAETVIQVTR